VLSPEVIAAIASALPAALRHKDASKSTPLALAVTLKSPVSVVQALIDVSRASRGSVFTDGGDESDDGIAAVLCSAVKECAPLEIITALARGAPAAILRALEFVKFRAPTDVITGDVNRSCSERLRSV